jgi:hypothetical protein
VIGLYNVRIDLYIFPVYQYKYLPGRRC